MKNPTIKQLSKYYADQGLINYFLAVLCEHQEELLEVDLDMNSDSDFTKPLNQEQTDLIDDLVSTIG